MDELAPDVALTGWCVAMVCSTIANETCKATTTLILVCASLLRRRHAVKVRYFAGYPHLSKLVSDTKFVSRLSDEVP